MNVSASISSSLTTSVGERLGSTPAGDASGGFSTTLSSVLGGRAADGAKTPRQAAEEFVAIALVQPILAQMRESEGAWGPFAPGDAEKRFAPLLDAEIAQRIVKKEGWGLVESIEAQLSKGQYVEASA